MSFLYGDLSPAPFVTNFLEELRDAVELAAAIADLDQVIVTEEDRREAMRGRVAEDMARVDGLARAVLAAAEAADKGEADSPATVLATGLAEALAERRAAVEIAALAKLDSDLAADEAATLAARRDYFPVLEAFFLAKQFPGARSMRKITLSPAAKKDERRYFGIIGGESDVGLDWSIELDVPAEGPWTLPLRVDRVLEDGLMILAPQVSGLIKKDLKHKKQKLDKHVITNVVDDGSRIVMKLRADAGEPDGFDIAVTIALRTVEVVKTGADDDPTVGLVEVAEDDITPLLDLAERVRALINELPRKRLVAARFEELPFDGTNVEAQPRLVELVPRMVAKLAPLVNDVSTRSRSSEELVLRRILDDDRREELFMSKARLRDQLHGLDAQHRALFALLEHALDAVRAPSADRISMHDAAPPIRAEVPPSGRPARRESGSMGAVVVAAPASPPVPAAEPIVEPTKQAPSDPVLEVTIEDGDEDEDEDEAAQEQEEEQVAAQAEEKAPAQAEENEDASENDAAPAPVPSIRTTELVATLKHIRAMTKDGRAAEALRQYATLFASSEFAMCSHDDQRKALKLLLHGNPTPPADDEGRAAFRAACPILQALVLHHRDPADYEMLGLAYVALSEPTKATEMYKRALEIERARNPASDLCGTLMRRVSEL